MKLSFNYLYQEYNHHKNSQVKSFWNNSHIRVTFAMSRRQDLDIIFHA